MSDPLVSIIVNCFNSERFLKDALDSIYMQDYSNWEIIFWDNASNDGSSKIARSYNDNLKYFKAKKTTSLGKARNMALSKANGKYLAFLDCDDRYLPGKIAKQVEIMESYDAALCYGSVIVIDEKNNLIDKNHVKENYGYLLEDLLMKYEINMQTVMIRRSVLLQNNLSFDLNLQFSPDYDLFMRIASQFKLYALADYLVEYRKSENSLTSKLVDRIAPEMEFTLNNIEDELLKYGKEVKNLVKARQMLNYYRSLSFVQSGDFGEARKLIFRATKVKKKYFLYLFLMFFPIKSSWMLKKMLR